MRGEPVIAIGLLTQTHLKMLGAALRQVIPLGTDGRFDDLLAELDRRSSHPPQD